MKDVTGLLPVLGKIAETLQSQSAKIAELEAELAKARKPCLHQISEPELPTTLPTAYVFTNVQSGDVEISFYEDAFDREMWHRQEVRLPGGHCHGTKLTQALPTAAASPSDLVTRESAMQAIQHVAIHNSASREREAVEMLAEAHMMPPVTPEEFSRDIAELTGTTSQTHVETLTALAEKYDRIVVQRRYANHHKSKIRWIVECGCFINYTEGRTLQEAVEAARQKFLES